MGGVAILSYLPIIPPSLPTYTYFFLSFQRPFQGFFFFSSLCLFLVFFSSSGLGWVCLSLFTFFLFLFLYMQSIVRQVGGRKEGRKKETDTGTVGKCNKMADLTFVSAVRGAI